MTILILLKGQPGSGKSTLGSHLAGALQLALLDKDDARDAFQAIISEYPQINWNQLSYDVLFNMTESQLRCGMSCIVDCPLARRELFDRASELAEKARYGANMAVVECVPTDQDIWAKRLAARGNEDAGTARAHKPSSMHDVKKIIQRNNGSERWSEDLTLPCRVNVDTTMPLDCQIQKVIAALVASSLIPTPR